MLLVRKCLQNIITQQPQLSLNRWSNTLPNFIIEKHRRSLNREFEKKLIEEKKEFKSAPKDYVNKFPEFLPNPDRRKRDRLAEKLEREDMFRRRSVIEIPEFYVGSIMAVTIVDPNTPSKESRFLGICIQRHGVGLRANFTLRNVIDGQGIEVCYDLYCPLISKIEVLRLEKRLDDELFYLRDAPQSFSTFPLDITPIQHPPNEPIPVNETKVKLNPRPWKERWERKNLKGIDPLELSEKLIKKAAHPQVVKAWEKYDLMKEYREKINEKESDQIMAEIFTKVSEINQEKQALLKKKYANIQNKK